MTRSERAYVGLGGNLGDPVAALGAALEVLAALPGSRRLQVSRFYRSPAWGPVAQPDYINAVAALDTSLPAQELMAALLEIERAAGRERRERWGPRVIDLDLLLYADQCLLTDTLQLPHPRMHERPFVLLPLAELDAGLVLPGHGPISGLIAALDRSSVEAIGFPP
jgi:2-amino-4-hydroxy-6-hydroxymethyldihydropteridine diphosphokinase